ncbi:hypothetical protein FACS189491_05190 [Spirochaetia bacterium]|nr:hypothetical protein FACS189491_05190 [Spirochaetia bacterium]
MRKECIPSVILFFSFFIGACSGLPSVDETIGAGEKTDTPAAANFWNSMPSNGLVFIGGAGIRSNRDESIMLALEDSARKISIFNAVEGEFVSCNKTGSGFLDYTADTQISLHFDEDYQGFVESLEYDPDTDIIQIDNTIFVRAHFNGPGVVQINYQLPSEQEGSKPGWIDNPPSEISGYRVGVGFAGRRVSHRDTVNAAFEAAIFSIIRETSSQVSSAVLNYQGSGILDYRSANDTTIRARGGLTGFYVLDTWMDPSNKAVWTLAICNDLPVQ